MQPAKMSRMSLDEMVFNLRRAMWLDHESITNQGKARELPRWRPQRERRPSHLGLKLEGQKRVQNTRQNK